MRRAIAAIAASSIMLGAAVAPTLAITKNYVQDFDHTYVGLIGFYTDDGEGGWVWSHRCTGELIAPTVVLTAGHCTDNENHGVNDYARIWFQQDAGANYDRATQHDDVTGYPDSCSGTGGNAYGTLCMTSHEMYNYGFDAFAGFPNTKDVGIVILDEPIYDLGQGTLPAPGTLNPLANTKGQQDTTFRVSGYGLSYQSGSDQGTNYYTISYRERLQAIEKLVNINNTSTAGYNLELNGNGVNWGGTCNGDSGGPVYYPSTGDQIVAVTSWGKTTGCRGDGFYYRLDRQDVLDWIQSVTGDAWDDIIVAD